MHTRKLNFLMFQIKFLDQVEVENLAGFEGHFKTIVCTVQFMDLIFKGLSKALLWPGVILASL